MEAANRIELVGRKPTPMFDEARQLFTVASLFSGCGGMDLGFTGGFEFLSQSYERLPFRVVWANDINDAAYRTYCANLGSIIHKGDVREKLDSLPERVDVVVGGFPCQDISINGKRRGIAGDRSGLYTAMVGAVQKCRPKVFVAENVKGLLLKYNRESLAQILADFRALGYNVDWGLYLAADYGVPQMRERVFIVGTLPGVRKFMKPFPTHPQHKWISCKQAIGDLELSPENRTYNHIWSLARRSSDQGSRVLKASSPSDTIRAECHGNIQFHYNLPRRMSMREAARMQSFPDNFLFCGGLREMERQVGNAVPPVLAWHIANSVRDCLE